METKLDRKRKAAEVRAEREKNIATLSEQLTEAKYLLRCIKGNDMLAHAERNTVSRKIHEIEDYIADERKAITEAENATDPIDVGAVAAQMVASGTR